ncbi:MAG: zinc ribbon domain-containing protein [Bacteroidota bacterium]
MEKASKFCQSCGMPMKKDPKSGGTNADGSKNLKYCSYCYENGVFTFNGTVEEFQDFCKQKMLKSGSPKFLAWLFTRGMRRLERWKMTYAK